MTSAMKEIKKQSKMFRYTEDFQMEIFIMEYGKMAVMMSIRYVQ